MTKQFCEGAFLMFLAAAAMAQNTVTGSLSTGSGGISAGGPYVIQNTGLKELYLWGGGNDGVNYYNAGVGGSIAYNGTNYIVGTDNGSNGGWMLRSVNEGGTLGIYTINTTGGTIQSISPSNIENYRRMTVTPSGYVGIGTAAPAANLEVNGGIKLTYGSAGLLTFADGTTQKTGLSASTLLTGSGTTASNYLQINANNGIPSYFGNVVNGQNDWSFNTFYDGVNWIYATANPTAAIRMGSGVGMMAFYTTPAGTASAINSTMDTTGPKMSLSLAGGLSVGNSYTSTDAGAGGLIVAGNVGIGTSSPGAKLEVNGAIKIDGGVATSTGSTAITFPDGSVQSVAWNGILSGGDYAESVDVTGDPTQYEPGDVLVVDPDRPEHFIKCSNPYSTAVAGIYSSNPGVRGRRQKTDQSHMKDEVPMAMIGVVPTKVTAENGSIKPGDLLVTSSRPGYAMKGTDRSELSGAIVGKALDILESKTGVIEVLVSLQ